jgi:hypothetical protein
VLTAQAATVSADFFLYFRSALHTFASRFARLIDLDSLTADDSGGLAFVQVLTGLLFGGLDSFDAFGGLDILAAFAGLNSLEALGLDTLDALNCFSVWLPCRFLLLRLPNCC